MARFARQCVPSQPVLVPLPGRAVALGLLALSTAARAASSSFTHTGASISHAPRRSIVSSCLVPPLSVVRAAASAVREALYCRCPSREIRPSWVLSSDALSARCWLRSSTFPHLCVAADRRISPGLTPLLWTSTSPDRTPRDDARCRCVLVPVPDLPFATRYRRERRSRLDRRAATAPKLHLGLLDCTTPTPLLRAPVLPQRP